MYTYQDLLKVIDDDKQKMDFVYDLIQSHKGSPRYDDAVIADEYARNQNRTIITYQKLLYTISGKAVPDNYSANYKICSNFFDLFISQENQYLLGNGVTWESEETKKKLGKDFDTRLQECGYEALCGGVAFGFWNYDHLEVLNLRNFADLYDEENGALMAGAKFWQVDGDKPLRATFYEVDGYTEYLWTHTQDGVEGQILQNKRPYKITKTGTPVDDMYIYNGENYSGFPIVPMWGNQHRQSELVGRRSAIDAYDLIKSGFANDIDDTSQIYWLVQNASGMDEIDVAKFINRIKRQKVAMTDDEVSVEAKRIDVPVASREALLDRLRGDLFETFMAVDIKNIANGAVTATQIEAAFKPLNIKVDKYEFCVLDFLQEILEIAGIDDNPTFARSGINNKSEEITTLIQAAQFLPEEFIMKKIVYLLGDADQYEDIKKMKDKEDEEKLERNPFVTNENQNTENTVNEQNE